MKRIAIIMAAVLALLTLVPIAARADGAPASSTAGLLTIDNKNVYAGMSKSYAAGYVPTRSGNNVRVVLPLLPGAAIAGNTITVTPNLGTPGSSPFVFGNYIASVKLAAHTVNNSASTVSCFLVDLTLPLASGRMRGSYPVLLAVDYKDSSGAAMQQTFTLYVTVNGKDPNAPPPAPTPEPVRHQPKVIVSKYAVDPDPVVAGKDFTLNFTLKNTSASYAVSNIKLTIKSDGADLTPADNTNTLYYTSLAKGKSLDVSFPMKAKSSATTDAHSVNVSVEYEDDKAVGFTASYDIPVTVTQPLRLTYDAPNIPQAMTAGDTAPFTLQVMNKGRSKVFNVTCVLSAPGLLPQASAFLGDMDPGTAKPAQIVVFAGSLDMTSDGSTASPDAASGFGSTSGTITITYEDEFGKEYKDTVKIGTTINAPAVPTAAPEAPAQPKASQWWVSALIAAALIAAVAMLLMLSRRNRERKVKANDEA